MDELAKDPACAPADGRIPQACSTESRKAIYVTPLRGGQMTRLGEEPPGDVHEPSWSPDGKSVVVAIGPNANQGRWELSRSAPSTLMILDAAGARYIGAQGETASWSPDGQWIAFFGEDQADVGCRGTPRSVGPRIYVIKPDGSGRREVFVNDLTANYPDWFWGGVPFEERQGKVFGPIAWSPDSSWFAFARQAEDGASIWKVEVATGRLERVTIPE
jgi:Tol biopolymer transport system component